MVSLAQILIDAIIAHNGHGSNLFGTTGSSVSRTNLVIQNAIDNEDIKYIHASTESSGCLMAAYEAGITGKIGINFVTSGPAVCMATMAIGTLCYEAEPLILITGILSNNFQYLSPEFLKPITRQIFIIDVDTVYPLAIIEEAFHVARNGSSTFFAPGPVALLVQNDAWSTLFNPGPAFLPNPPRVNPIINKCIADIRTSISPHTKVIVRVGERLSSRCVQKLAVLTESFPNFYVHLVANGDNKINSYHFTNVGIENRIGNIVVNNNYLSCNVVVQIGLGVLNPITDFIDIRALTDRQCILWYIDDEVLPLRPPSSHQNNTIVVDVNQFTSEWLDNIVATYAPSKVSWANQNYQKYAYDFLLLNRYAAQTKDSVLTTVSIIAQALRIIYRNQTQHKKMVIDDTCLYATDVGLSSFIGQSLIHHKRKFHTLSLCEFSSIGSSPPAIAGRLMSNRFEDVFMIIGDGAFLNSPGLFIDLTNTLATYSDIRAFVLLLNDHKYSSEYVSEKEMFGRTTSIASTESIQRNISISQICEAMMGNRLVKSLTLTSMTTISKELENFTDSWYNRVDGFQRGGYYLVYYTTYRGIPNPLHNI
jgi:thiamine pyrophosphate-dependent acetolactate synthase large subunit-like protein